MAGNVRIRSEEFPGNIWGHWSVRPSNSDLLMPDVWACLEDLQKQEPGMRWRVEVRGEDADWHWWKD